ncbi:hypothetical protein R1sor_024807 [Riccia sorocarpa]|uniref:F-box protein n=1 Tax=Riccia sorocarpa TaxID=122646 RepID=A0ABD3GVN1_9MARC
MFTAGEDLGSETSSLDNDIFFEVLKRVDPVTLATVSCANSEIRKLSEDEVLWEKFCNERWPSTKDPSVRALINEVGGFRKLYAKCYPLIISNEHLAVRDVHGYGMDGSEDDKGGEEGFQFSPSDLISLVDVVHGEKCIFTKTIHGIPEADAFPRWFSSSPFRIDLLRSPEEEDERGQEEQAPVMIAHGLPSIVSFDRERKHGKFWKALLDDVRVSWITINKRTKEMASLSSWRPLGGSQQWPRDGDFLVRFGSVLPSHRSCFCSTVHCNIVMKCRLINTDVGETVNLKLRLTELSLQLQDMGGVHMHVNGKESLVILRTALRCPRSRLHEEVLSSYNQYLKVHTERKERKTQQEGRLDTAVIVSGTGVFMFICSFIIWLVPKLRASGPANSGSRASVHPLLLEGIKGALIQSLLLP